MTLLEDTIMFSCYIALLYLAIFANRSPLTVINHNEVVDLLSGIHTRTKSYTSIGSINEYSSKFYSANSKSISLDSTVM
jgi:hypothetical protein